MRLRQKFTKVIAALLCLGVILGTTACTPKSKTANGEGTKTSSGTDLSNTLAYAGENTDTINPILNRMSDLSTIIFSGLMKYDATGKPVPDLAESYQYDEAKLTYTFKLRKGVLWHDGKPLTVDDVVFTYNKLTTDKTLAASILSDYEDIAKVTAKDQDTVEIVLSKYNAAMLDYFTVGLIPKHLLEGKDIATDSFNQNPVGTGKYKFSQWDKTSGTITVVKNDKYYGKVPNIDKVVYKTVSVESTKATMLESGEADLAWLNANYAAKFRNKDGFRNFDFKTADYRAVSMDFRTKFWMDNKDSVGVLNYAVDKAAVVKSVLNSQGCAAYSPIQLNAFGGNKGADIYPYDMKKFVDTMEKLGWKKGSDGIYERNGQKFHFTIQVRDYEEERVSIANIVSKQLKEAGVEMEIVLVTKFDWKAGYNGFLSGFAVEFDPDGAYKQFLTTGSSNTMKYSNTAVDDLLIKARQAKDTSERKKIYGEFESAFSKEPASVLIAYLDGNYVGVKGLTGLNTQRVLGHHAVGVMWNIEEWKLNKSQGK